MWITFSVHYPLTVMLADLCIEIDTEVNSNSNTSSNQIFDLFLACSNIPAFQSIRDLVNRQLNNSVSVGCDGLKKYCALKVPCYGYPINDTNCDASSCQFDPNVNCSGSTMKYYALNNIVDIEIGCPSDYNNATNASYPYIPNNATCNKLSLSNYTCNIDSFPAPPVVCSDNSLPILQCADLCVSDASKNVSAQIRTGVLGLDQFNELVVDHIDPLLSCQIIKDGFKLIFDDICVCLVNSLFYITMSSGVLGGLFVFGIVNWIVAIKRFNSQNKQASWEY